MNYKKIQIFFFLSMLIGVLFLTIYIFWDYIYSLIFAMTLAIVFYPLFKKINAYFRKHHGIPAILTVVIVLIIILVPLILLGFALVQEAREVIINIQNDGFGSTKLLSKIQEFIDKTFPFAKIDLLNNSQNYLKNTMTNLIENMGPIVSNILSIVVGFFLTLFAMYYLLKDGHKFKQQLIIFSPLADKYDKQIFLKLIKAVNSVMKGSLLIAIIQGFLLGLGLWIFGVPSPILWGSVGVVAALVPAVGTGMIIIPTTLYLILTHHVIAGIGLLCWGILIVGLIDNLLRPKLIEKDIKLHPLLIFLSVIGGINTLGPFGFLLGPIILSLLFALLDIYKQEFREYLNS